MTSTLQPTSGTAEPATGEPVRRMAGTSRPTGDQPRRTRAERADTGTAASGGVSYARPGGGLR